MEKIRCDWVLDNELSKTYHDEEWGNLERFEDDHYLFEMLTLEGAQAGLSWHTILQRRENYRVAFDYFDPEIVANYNQEKVETLIEGSGIIRNRRKIASTIENAKAFLTVQAEYGSFHQFLWQFVGKKQLVHEWASSKEVPASNDLSKKLSKELKRRGFSFVGPVICYAYLQAIGLINDHTTNCFLHPNNRQAEGK